MTSDKRCDREFQCPTGDSDEVKTISKLICDDVTSSMGRQRVDWIETKPPADPGGSFYDRKKREEQM